MSEEHRVLFLCVPERAGLLGTSYCHCLGELQRCGSASFSGSLVAAAIRRKRWTRTKKIAMGCLWSGVSAVFVKWAERSRLGSCRRGLGRAASSKQQTPSTTTNITHLLADGRRIQCPSPSRGEVKARRLVPDQRVLVPKQGLDSVGGHGVEWRQRRRVSAR